MVVGDQPFVYYFYLFNIYFSGTGLATVFTTGGGGVQDPSGLLRGIAPDAYSYLYSMCTDNFNFYLLPITIRQNLVLFVQ